MNPIHLNLCCGGSTGCVSWGVCTPDAFVTETRPYTASVPAPEPKTTPAPVPASGPGVKIRAVMSMPRLAFTDNMFCALRELIPLGIPLERAKGVFWGQGMTRMMESALEDGTDYLLTLDYDTWFTRNHVWRLAQLMQEHPEYDAIASLQVIREGEWCLFGLRDSEGRIVTSAPLKDFEADVVTVGTAHFGLTIFRAGSLRRLRKPWFLPVPDPSGGWGEGRQDEDIYFWNNFSACGLKAGLAPEVKVGHLQLMATFPGRLEDQFKAVHWHIKDLDAGSIPDWIEPKIEVKKTR